ncbi:uncharacterized protein EAE97_007441 [Botrytis byssoidea]|uniref:Uncharacterized protein n=1 Tax=Botrytis byssoidea TaxID=139641 RepID=A0A9P5IFC9_9HELO|nr:uncharacterized protein EAE97_007441 [Botrytis byssoidea]KAF7939361.1 hypothetical protein EAE97_007441 [Botrytis byssoidea]
MNTNINTTSRNGFYESGINSPIDQYTVNSHIMVRSRDDPASHIDGAQRRLPIRNSLDTTFKNDGLSKYRSMSFEIDKMQNSRIKEHQVEGHHTHETALHGFNDIYPNEEGGRLENLDVQDWVVNRQHQHADDQNQGFKNGSDRLSVQGMPAFELTENDDCEYEIVSPEETKRLWGIIPETGGGNDVSSQVQTTLPLSNEGQQLILGDNNSSYHHKSNNDLGKSFYDTWDRNVISDRMAGLSGSNQEKVIGNGLLATETQTGLEQLCSQYGMPDLTDQIPESIEPSQFPQIHTQIPSYPHSDENYSYIPRKRTRTHGANTGTIQAGGMDVAEDLSDPDGRFEMNEIDQGSHTTTKRKKLAKTKNISQPRVEQPSYCMSRVNVSLEEMKAIDPDYDKHPHKAFFPERMKFAQQAGLKSILLPTRMINLLNAHRQKAREEERKNSTGRKIPRDFKLRPVRHKDFAAFQEARRKEEETRSYENRQRRFAKSEY